MNSRIAGKSNSSIFLEGTSNRLSKEHVCFSSTEYGPLGANVNEYSLFQPKNLDK